MNIFQKNKRCKYFFAFETIILLFFVTNNNVYFFVLGFQFIIFIIYSTLLQNTILAYVRENYPDKVASHLFGLYENIIDENFGDNPFILKYWSRAKQILTCLIVTGVLFFFFSFINLMLHIL